LREVFPTTQHQRCWNHRTLNLLDKLPKRLQAEARQRLREIATAPTQAECERLRTAYVADLVRQGQAAAADTLMRDWEDFVRYYQFPQEHWIHLRTSNPIESVFSGVRLRNDAAKRLRQREAALYLVFKIVERLSRNWRMLNGGATLMTLLLEGSVFKDGVLQPRPAPDANAAAPAA
jgi:putative transposase